MKKFPQSMVVAGLVLLFFNGVQAEMREWTRVSDGKKMSAEFAGMKDETTVKVKLASGQIFELPLSGLSAEDNAFVKAQGSKGATVTKPTTTVTGAAKPVVPEGPVTITVSKVHLCCKACEESVKKIPENETTPVPAGVTITPDRKAESIIITAPSGNEARAALGAVFANGFYGVSDNEAIKIADLAPDDFTTNTMIISRPLLCCSGSLKALLKAVKSADGVDECEATVGGGSAKVSGKDFKPYDVMKALREVGLGGAFQ